jgi:hypothetical protein
MKLEQMQFSSVTFVLIKTILWELSAKVTHDPVTRNLGDHAGGSDAHADAIAIDDGCLRKWKRNHGQPINQDVIGRVDYCFDREAHGAMARAQNVDPIDFDGINDTNSPSDFGISRQFAIDFLAQFGQELFGIIQAAMTEFFGKNYRGGHHWTGQGAATGFVNPGNARNPGGPQFLFVTKSAAPVHPLRRLSDFRIEEIEKCDR